MTNEINLTSTASLFQFSAPAANGKVRTITGRTWGQPNDSQAAVLLVHGLGAHSGWWETLARRLKVKGIYALAYDQAGFGKRQKDEFDSYKQWLEDVSLAYKHLRAQVGNKPIYLIGNSMGAAVSYAAATSEPLSSAGLSGLVLFSPGFDGYPKTFHLAYRLSALFQALIDPQKEIPTPYSFEKVTQNARCGEWMQADPDQRFAVPGKMLFELLKLTSAIQKAPKVLSMPFLMLTSGQDFIVNNKVSATIFDATKCPAKARKHYADAYHDMMFDEVIDEACQDLIDWILCGREAATPSR